MPSFHFTQPRLTPEQFQAQLQPFTVKMKWFLEHSYGRTKGTANGPHYYQALFHTLRDPFTDRICRFRSLVAGRRGGKSLSAAWEVLFYVLNPSEFHWDAHREESDEPLHVWVLTKDLKVGFQPLLLFRKVIADAGLVKGTDYDENRGELYFTFPNGSLVMFKTAVDPQSLRGPGLDILWMDEAAFILDREAYDVTSPALDDKEGIVICTTTPDGKNWFFDEFIGSTEPVEKKTVLDGEFGSVEYRSIDNPYFPKKSWEHRKRTYHPLLFKQEFEASFDSMAGKELPGEWLTNHFYEWRDLPQTADGRVDWSQLDLFIGVDPAISLADTADHFAIAVVGVLKSGGAAFLIDIHKTRIPFAEQVDLIKEKWVRYRPQMIGIESQAYQAALTQQVQRLEGLPPVVPMMATGKKHLRILAMSTIFKIGLMRVRKDQRDFIDEWIDYDTQLKNPKDDALDAVEIAIRTAGVLLPWVDVNPQQEEEYLRKGKTLAEIILEDLPGNWNPSKLPEDEHLGAAW